MVDQDDPAVEHVDAEGLEEGPVEGAPGLVVGVLVELVGVGGERDHLGDQLGAGSEFDVDVGDALFDGVALHGDVVHELVDLGGGADAAHQSLQEAVFALVEVVELLVEVAAQLTAGGLVVVDAGADRLLEPGRLLLAQVEARAGVVVLDGAFEWEDLDVGEVAAAAGTIAAAEVGVLVVLHFGVDEATSPPSLVAAIAPQVALQVVVQLRHADVGGGAGVEDVLDPVEEFLVDDGFVAAFVELVVVVDPPGVVGVTEDAPDAVARERAFGPVLAGGASGEALLAHDVGERIDAVGAGGVELEHRPHQGCS
ncbi:hypothetical protein C0Z10_08180 [Acidipropionibacterium jensenii]|uniref:Uncharacterized protein n=1 Tax=Acidipropionibacterium jensenii TaxID=1749 RepID=A0A3Q9UEH6_9ACTN|nr:hypothetical protein [Acidipropionibacterium jensenii]AZZ39734.1 hypothetical protein C0Z10_08180 [Acidipropionibacterium jensenii]